MASWLKRTWRQLQRGEKYDLSFILAEADPSAPISSRIEWLERLLDWVRYTGEGQSSPTTRLKFLLQLLERNPQWKKNGALVIRSILVQTSSERFFSETGIPTASTFFREFVNRFVRVFIPYYEDPTSLASVQGRVFYDMDDPQWLLQIPDPILYEVIQWIASERGTDDFGKHLMNSACDACSILVIKAAAIALREDISERSPEYPVSRHPLLKLEAELAQMNVYAKRIVNGSSFDLKTNQEKVNVHIQESRRLLKAVLLHLEEFGVSVDLVYQIDCMNICLSRIETLSEIIFSSLLIEKTNQDQQLIHWKTCRNFLAKLIQGYLYDQDFSYILKKNFAILSRKVVERTGVSGEDLFTYTRREYWHLFWMAAGGGVIVAGTALVKYAVNTHSWPIFIEFVYNSINYSMSFVLMHWLGFKLATKQPSMTAAALASKLKESDENEEAFVGEVASIARSQFAALLGNICALIPVAWFVDFALSKTWSGVHIISQEKARYILDSVHPGTSLAVFYAGLTGLVLWLASMAAGWVENAVVFYRLPEIIRHHKILRRLFGDERTTAIADSMIKNTTGIAGSISLGVFLSLMPMLGKFFGLPLDIRHVTITSASVVYAFCSLGLHPGLWSDVTYSLIGMVLIGSMNFGVSFLMATFIAVRAQDVSRKRLVRIFMMALHQFRRSPLQFFFPKKTNGAKDSVKPISR